MQQQDALKHLTAEQKWETVITERAKAKGGGSRRGSTGGIGKDMRREEAAKPFMPHVLSQAFTAVVAVADAGADARSTFCCCLSRQIRLF